MTDLQVPIRVEDGDGARLLLTGDWVDASEALSLGLVMKVVDPEDIMPTTLDLARQIARMPAEATTSASGTCAWQRYRAAKSRGTAGGKRCGAMTYDRGGGHRREHAVARRLFAKIIIVD
jgi:enoyl-CoA hydratase/carnithine racemase